MDHRQALRAAIKGPPAGWRGPRGRPWQTWSLWTVETSSRGSHWLEWAHGDSCMYAPSWRMVYDNVL